MDKKAFLKAVEEMGTEKGISSDVIIDAIQESFQVAYTKKLEEEYSVYKSKASAKQASKVKLNDALIRCEVNLVKGTINLYHQLKVVNEDDIEDDFIEIGLEKAQRLNPKLKLGDFYEEEVDFDEFSKADVNRFVSCFKQKIASAEKAALLEAFHGRIGDIVTGTVEKADSHYVIVNLGRTSVTLFPKDLIGKETFKPGDPIKVYIVGIGKDDKKGSLIEVSRSCPGFLRKLFENEIHEIYDQTVIIKDVARLAGVRSKVAVYSNDPNVDPSGACIGTNGNRIQAIVSQLGNARESKEKIDVITYNPNLGLYLEECLKPGIMLGAKIDLENKEAIVVCQNDTSSLAIGLRGSNVILARQLTKLQSIQVIDEREAIEKGIEYKTIEEFTIEAREEERKRYREQSLQNTLDSTIKTQLESKVIEPTPVEIDDEEFEDTSDLVEETPVVEETKVEKVKEEKVEPVKEEVKVEKKEKSEEPVVKVNVKTTSTLESLEKSLEEEKERENKKSTFKKNKKKEEKVEETDLGLEQIKDAQKMSIYTEEELADFDDELEDEYEDEDYSDYDSDDYYEDK
ncbi:MAG: transcription termination factor NusA [Bacilli bacterium]|nr:transcription termination factor NusA [Bacilli bacterium]